MRLNRWKPVLILAASVLCLLAWPTPSAAQSWSNGYAHRLAITINHTKVPNTDQTNFPFLFSGTYSYLATIANGGNVTNSNGYDIIFTSDAGGATSLAFEQESYNASTGAVNYWIQIPTLSHTINTVIYMFYGNSGISTDQSNQTAVWDSNFAGVWHLPNGTTLTANDSTGNGNNATVYGTPAATAGQIDGAATFGASSANYLQASDAASLRIANTITLSAWIYNTADNANGGLIVEKRDPTTPGNNFNYGLWLVTGGELYFQFNDGSYQASSTSTGAVPKNTWTYVVVSVNESTQLVSFYVNGSLYSTTAKSGTMPSSGTGVLQIGNYGTFNGGVYSFEGILDEVRTSNNVRSADWIATEYNNQSNPSTFYGIGTPTVSSLSPSSGATATSITITGTNFGSTQGGSTVAFNGVTATPTSWNPTSVVVPVPSGATPGDVVVTVGGVASNSAFFMVPSTWSNGYSYRRAITIDHTKVPNTDQTNFPVLVSGTYPYLANTGSAGYVTNSNGYDIIFTSDAAGANTLSYETESYNSSTGAVNYWVKIPTVSHTATETVFYMFYGNSSVTTDQSNKTAVWDSNYAGVWHLPNGTSLTANDSTSNGNNGVISSPSAVAGVIDGGASFNGTSDYIDLGHSASLDVPNNLTVSGWVKINSYNGSNYQGIFAKRVGSGPDTNFGINFNNSLFQLYANNGSWQVLGTPSSAFSAGTWYYVVGTFAQNGSNTNTTLYKNGSVLASSTLTGNIATTSADFYLGESFPGGEYGNISLDEVRLSGTSRSADWIATEYNNQSGPSTFYSVWSAATGGGGSGASTNITSLSLTSGAVGSSVTITGTNFNAAQNDSTVTFSGVTAIATTWSDSQIVVKVPSGATTGNVVVGVSGVNSNGVSFTVLPTPTITSLSITTGAVGALVTITGTNFGSSQGRGAVTFNGAAASVTTWSATSIVVPVPAVATTGNVMVFASAVNTNGVSFTVVPAPTITSLSVTTGAVGAAVTITGTNFGSSQGTSTVAFNGTAATPTSWSATSIVVPVPSGATTGNISVFSSGVNTNGVSFTVVPAPSVSSLTPSSAPIGGSITVTGTSFGATQGSGQVEFGSVVATVGSWSDTSITVTVPLGAASGSLTVLASGVTSNTTSFTLIESGSISSISPTTGLIGSSVTINGTGFGPAQSNSGVAFNTFAATTVSSWSDTQIVAVVPYGSSPGAVSVTVAGITAQGPTFVPTSKAQVTDSLGNSSSYMGAVSGGQWHPTNAQGSGCSSCTVRGATQYQYDAFGNVTSMTDPAGHTTTNTYDSSNNLLSQSVQLNSTAAATTSYTYNSFGEVLTVTDALGNVTTNVYDSNGNLTSVTSPAPNSSTAASVTTFAYNSLGELTSITDQLSHVTAMTYTTAGLIATITDAQNNVTTYAYDLKGNRTSVTDALSHQTTYAYDAMSRLTTITYPDTTTSTFAYDSRGRRTSVTDQNGKTTTYAYDDADRLTSVTDAASHVTYYAYDTENNLTSITDANSNQTAFTYDAFGRVTQTNFPSSLSENYQYDADNNLTSKTDRKGQTITYLYDALNRLTSKTYPDTTAVDYVYDLVGKIQQVNDPTGTYAFAYDNMGRLIGTTTSYSFLTSRSFTNAYTYDAASNRTGFIDPESGSTAYTYDALNRLASLAPPSAFGSGSFGFTYDALSRRTQMTRPNSVTTNYTYDNLSRLTSVLHQLSGSTIDGSSYTLDSAGNRTAKTDQLASSTSNYTYDAINQLTQVTQANNTTESFSYDAVGNRTASLGVSSYTTNASNELTATSSASYTYDSNGDMTSKTVGSNTTSYTWDFENRLSSVTLPGSGGTVTFKYDPMGRRIYKSSSSSTSVFAYDGDNLIEETNSSGTVVARYTQTQNIDEPLAMLRSSATSYYNADGLGSVTSLSNTSGALAQTYTYDSFGNITASSGSLTSPFQYTGREMDPETGLYYYRARYYDPKTGRFLSEDHPNATSDIHGFYQYARNNPALWIDPTGLDPTPQGPPPVPVPGGGPGNGWKWNENPRNPRGGTWGPQTPIPGQSQPTGSWDPDGHWDVDNGRGRRDHYDPNGNPIAPENIQRFIPCPAPAPPNLSPAVVNTIGTIGTIALYIILIFAF